MKRILFIFFISFILNLVWENLHSLLYSNYMGGRITEFILLRATLADAVMITLITLPFVVFKKLRKFDFLIIIFGIFIAIIIEQFALASYRWQYNQFMPIIPILLTGLTPTIQLGILGFLSYKITDRG